VRFTRFVILLVLASCKGACGSDPAPTGSAPVQSATPEPPPTAIASIVPLPPLQTAVMARIATDPKLQGCFYGGSAADAGSALAPFSGDMRVELTIAADGKVTAAKETTRTSLDDKVSQCVLKQLSSFTFEPAPGKQSVINVPIRRSH
jgi:hypothetical protein